MKTSLFALIAFAFIAGAHASELKSIDECTVALYKSNPWTRSYVIEGSRKTGLGANRVVNQIRRNNAKVSAHVDALGVKRYETITLKTVLESEGNANNCGGESSANEVKICTTVGNDSTCETRCEMNWVGPDCR